MRYIGGWRGVQVQRVGGPLPVEVIGSQFFEFAVRSFRWCLHRESTLNGCSEP